MIQSKQKKQAPRNISLLDLLRYRLPWAGKASILHRVSGALLFLALPILLMAFEHSLGRTADSTGAWFSPGGVFTHPIVKALSFILIWAYLHHFLAGIRYLLLDLHLGIDKASATRSAKVASLGAIALSLVLGGRLLGWF